MNKKSSKSCNDSFTNRVFIQSIIADTSRVPTANDIISLRSTRTSIPFSIELLPASPQAKYIKGQGKRKPKSSKSSWHITEELKVKNSPKNPTEKRKRQVTKNFTTMTQAIVI